MTVGLSSDSTEGRRRQHNSFQMLKGKKKKRLSTQKPTLNKSMLSSRKKLKWLGGEGKLRNKSAMDTVLKNGSKRLVLTKKGSNHTSWGKQRDTQMHRWIHFSCPCVWQFKRHGFMYRKHFKALEGAGFSKIFRRQDWAGGSRSLGFWKSQPSLQFLTLGLLARQRQGEGVKASYLAILVKG